MEANRKRRGFVKSKLMPFYNRSSNSKSSQASNMYINSMANPSQASYLVNTPPPTKQKLAYVVPSEINSNNDRVYNKVNSQFDRVFGVVGDEHVDARAASYISAVQERFKLERVNSKHENNNNHILQESSLIN